MSDDDIGGYLALIDSLTVALANGQVVKVSQVWPRVLEKVHETYEAMGRRDRITWALRIFKKALISELLWLIEHEPEYIQEKARALPARDQPGLRRALAKLTDVDIRPFAEADPDDPDLMQPPYAGFPTIDGLNQTMGDYLKVCKTYGEREVVDPQTHQKHRIEAEPTNPINMRINPDMPVGYVMSGYRRGQLELLKKYTCVWEAQAVTNEPPFDLRDSEGRVETIVKFSNGRRWFNLHRKSSILHGRETMGHHGNTLSPRQSETIYELDEPIIRANEQVWKPHLIFIFDTETGLMGEMKGRANTKPSPGLWRYIVKLFTDRKEIKGLLGGGNQPERNFFIKDLTPNYIEILKRERPEFWQNSALDQLPGGTRELPH